MDISGDFGCACSIECEYMGILAYISIAFLFNFSCVFSEAKRLVLLRQKFSP